MSKIKKILGIDLGTTYSCVAHLDASGKPVVIPNSLGMNTTPSAVWFEGNTVHVGQEAKEEAPISPQDVAVFIKREMGSDSYRFHSSQGEHLPQEVSSYILKKLVKDAEEYLNEPIKDVVITCPAYFDHKAREATKDAGTMAGLTVHEVLNEPTAAALAYAYKFPNKYDGRHVLVYDLGGGTFDVSVIRISSDKQMEVIYSDGDHNLGGKDWDDVLLKMLKNKLAASAEFGATFEGPATMKDLQLLAENTKRKLTSSAQVTVPYLHDGEKLSARISREEFDAETASLLERTREFTAKVINKAREAGAARIDEIILVGGSTYMPQVSKMLENAFGLTPLRFEPDEAVAKGAAIAAMSHALRKTFVLETRKDSAGPGGFKLEGQTKEEVAREVSKQTGFTLETVKTLLTPPSNVCSRGFGQSLHRLTDDKIVVFNLIYRNTKLPVRKSMTSLTRVDNQQSVNISVYDNLIDIPSTAEEEKQLNTYGIECSKCDLLWEGNLPIKSGMPKGSPIETVFELTEDGLLRIFSRDPASGKTIEGEVQTKSSISSKEMKKLIKKVGSKNVE